jgi:hypothetical protein
MTVPLEATTLHELGTSDGLSLLVACVVGADGVQLSAWEPARQWPAGHEVTRVIGGAVFGLLVTRWQDPDEAGTLALAHAAIRAVSPEARVEARRARSGFLTR